MGLQWKFSENDVILYNLSLGCKAAELRYVYENNDHFTALPSFHVLALHKGAADAIRMEDVVENFNPMMLLHGEQFLEIYQPLSTSGDFEINSNVVRVESKGKAALVVIGVKLLDSASGKTVSYAEALIFLRGASPRSDSPSPQLERPADATATHSIPEREPDACVEEQTTLEMAAIYRLNGDPNPLHIDPEFAGIAGFPQPILHGLCTFGIAVKHVSQAFGGGDPNKVKSMKARFAKHVFPGETLKTEMWQDGHDLIIFQTKAVERNVVVLSSAAVRLLPQKSSPRL